MSDTQMPATPPVDADERMLNDRSGYQGCFGCGAQNATGLQLVFHRDGDEIWAEYTPDERFQGFPGVLHGGVLATMLDETLSRAAVFAGQWMMTARLEIRYRRAAPLGRPLRVSAQPTRIRAKMVSARGAVVLADEPEVVLAEAEGVFLPVDREYERDLIAQRPELSSFFQRE
jgi:acyl-coenzyme A thioesterase PaaI-like protein